MQRTTYGNGPRIDKEKLAPPNARSDVRSKGLAGSIGSSSGARIALETIPSGQESEAHVCIPLTPCKVKLTFLQTTADQTTLDLQLASRLLSREAADDSPPQLPSKAEQQSQAGLESKEIPPAVADGNLPQFHLSRASTWASRNDNLDPGSQNASKHMMEVGPVPEEYSDNDIESTPHDSDHTLESHEGPRPIQHHNPDIPRVLARESLEQNPSLLLQRNDDFPLLETVMSPPQDTSQTLEAGTSASTSVPSELKLKCWTPEKGSHFISKHAVDGKCVVVYDPKSQTQSVMSTKKLLDDYRHSKLQLNEELVKHSKLLTIRRPYWLSGPFTS